MTPRTELVGYKIGLGTGLVFIGVVTWVFTYKYVTPIGSTIALLFGIAMILSGLHDARTLR